MAFLNGRRASPSVLDDNKELDREKEEDRGEKLRWVLLHQGGKCRVMMMRNRCWPTPKERER